MPLLVVVSGAAGAGASTAAIAALRALDDPPPRGALYADLGHATDPPTDPADVLGDWMAALGAPDDYVPSGTPERAAWMRSLTSTGVAMLLDGAISAAQVRPLLPGGPSLTVITSRTLLTGLAVNGAQFVHV